jgi:hypothetical protein
MSKFKFGVTMTKESLDTIRLIHELPERMNHVIPMLAYLSADFVRRFVQSKIPRTQSYKSYRRGLEVARIRGGKPGEGAYVVQVDMANPAIKKIKPKQVLLEVVPSKRVTKPNKAVLVLQQYNPWTFESLPFKPDSRDGLVVQRKSTPRKVAQITRQRLKQRSVWNRALAKVGFRNTKRGQDIKLPAGIGGRGGELPTLSLDALKLEFGLGGVKPKPAWRLGVQQLMKRGLHIFSRDSKYFVFPLTKWSYKMWKKWPPRLKHAATQVQASRYRGFQKKLGIRVS